jgi:TPP-dependent indolepyruvate ferredoxin oxidoreductase alpha subunit
VCKSSHRPPRTSVKPAGSSHAASRALLQARWRTYPKTKEGKRAYKRYRIAKKRYDRNKLRTKNTRIPRALHRLLKTRLERFRVKLGMVASGDDYINLNCAVEKMILTSTYEAPTNMHDIIKKKKPVKKKPTKKKAKREEKVADLGEEAGYTLRQLKHMNSGFKALGNQLNKRRERSAPREWVDSAVVLSLRRESQILAGMVV